MRFTTGRALLLAIAMATAFSALPVATAAAGTPSGTTCGTMNIGYGGATGCFRSTTVTNSNWTIVNSTLQVTGSYGWVSTFTFQQKTTTGTDSSKNSASGTVTDTTEYGTSTISFTAPYGAAPFGVSNGSVYLQGYWHIPAGNIWADGSSAQGAAIFNAQYAMVYYDGGQNAGYWFGAL